MFSDIHGHFDEMIGALDWFANTFPNHMYTEKDDSVPVIYTVVLLGDFVDNGNKIPDVLDWLQEAAGNDWVHPNYPRFQLQPILGNHDMACLLSLNSDVFHSKYTKGQWWDRWTHFWNEDGSTPGAYSVSTQTTFKEQFPHADLLEHLPWYHKEDGYVFVHAGLKQGVHFSEQITYLDLKDLCVKEDEYQMYQYDIYKTRYGMPDQLTNKGWENTNDPDWGCIVVTGHNKYLGRKNFISSHRLGLHSGSCEGHSLHCAILPRGATQMTQEHLVKDGRDFKVFDFRNNISGSGSSSSSSSSSSGDTSSKSSSKKKLERRVYRQPHM